MKPGQKPYDRHSKLWLSIETVNPCNHFIVEFLIRSKIRMEKQRSSHYYCYNLAIQSVKKYPMPLICASQLKVIEGFGDFFVEETMKVIKKHYLRGRLPTPQQRQRDQAEQFESLRLHMQRKKIMKHSQLDSEYGSCDKNSVIDKSSIIQKSLSHLQIPRDSESIRFIKSLKSQQTYNPSQISDNKSLISSIKSSKSQNEYNKPFNPRPGSEAFIVLSIVYERTEENIKKGFTKGCINQILYNRVHKGNQDKLRQKNKGLEQILEKQQKIKSWKSVRQKLQNNGYIIFDEYDEQLFYLTQKGRQYMQKIIQRQKQKYNKKKNQKLAKKQAQQSSYQYSIQNNHRSINHFITKKKQAKKKVQKQSVKRSKQQNFIIQEDYSQGSGQLLLLIDSRKLENNYTPKQLGSFFKKLKSKVNYELTDIYFGNFMWEYKGSIINAIISIIDLSIYDQDEILAVCRQLQILNIINTKILVLQTKPKSQISQNLLQTICNAKIKGYRVHRSESVNQTVKIVSKYHKIFMDFQKKQKLVTISPSLKQFENVYQVKDPYILNNIFNDQLRQLPTLSLSDKVENVQQFSRQLGGFSKLKQKLRNRSQQQGLVLISQQFHNNKIYPANKSQRKSLKMAKFLKDFILALQYW